MAEVFRGNNITRVDEKNRLKLPADFKRLMDEKCGPGASFFITSMDGRRAQLYPMAEWELKETALAKLPSVHPVRLKFQKHTAYYGAQVEMDVQGRLLLPSPIRETANLTGEVVVLGMSGSLEPGFLEVANHDAFKAEMKDEPLTQADLDVLAALGV